MDNTTVEEKAKELIEKFYNEVSCGVKEVSPTKMVIAKQCALICCDEIIAACPVHPTEGYHETIADKKDDASEYWQSVRTAIENH